jgi:hypothetical protein
MTRASETKPAQGVTVNRAIARLTAEAYALRKDMAALKALAKAGGRVGCLFMQVTSSALQSDLLARLIRVLEQGKKVKSFWFLCRCGVLRVDGDAIAFLTGLTGRLTGIRNKVFMHIDKDGLDDPQKFYREANICWPEVEMAVAKVSSLAARLYEERLGRPAENVSIADLEGIFDRDLNRFGGWATADATGTKP